MRKARLLWIVINMIVSGCVGGRGRTTGGPRSGTDLLPLDAGSGAPYLVGENVKTGLTNLTGASGLAVDRWGRILLRSVVHDFEDEQVERERKTNQRRPPRARVMLGKRRWRGPSYATPIRKRMMRTTRRNPPRPPRPQPAPRLYRPAGIAPNRSTISRISRMSPSRAMPIHMSVAGDECCLARTCSDGARRETTVPSPRRRLSRRASAC